MDESQHGDDLFLPEWIDDFEFFNVLPVLEVIGIKNRTVRCERSSKDQTIPMGKLIALMDS